MADSFAHKLGELIGVFFEECMKKPVAEFAASRSLYFDTCGSRSVRRGRKVTWTDVDGNRHDLDYVLERGGTDKQIGDPVAFIELAWRRYTKHSKNKAQEIYGAVNPIAQKYSRLRPFKGAMLSGDFTITSLDQLQSQGFSVLYIPFKKIVTAFKNHGLDIYFDEKTSEETLQRIVNQWKGSSKATFMAVQESLYDSCKGEIAEFIKALRMSIDRKLRYVHIVPTYGTGTELKSVAAAIEFIQNIPDVSPGADSLHSIEIVVAFDNGTRIEGRFLSREEAVAFLKNVSI